MKRKYYLAHRIRRLVEATCQDVPETLFWQLLQLIDLHEREEEETEKRKQDKKPTT